MMKFKEYVDEKFSDMGKLSKEQLKKGQDLDKESEGNFKLVDARVFLKAIQKIKENDLAKGLKSKGLDTLTIYNAKEYSEMDCYLGINNSSGYAIHEDELVSVFSSQGKSGSAIVKSAIKNGARRLDCYAERHNGKISGLLYSLYSKNGFKIDTGLNSGEKGEMYSIQKGVSSYVNDNDEVEEDNPTVVIFMKI